MGWLGYPAIAQKTYLLYNKAMSFGAFFALSFSLCIRFVSRIAFAVLVGYCIDKFFGTSPWVMILSTIVGGYVGWLALVNVYKKGPDA